MQQQRITCYKLHDKIRVVSPLDIVGVNNHVRESSELSKTQSAKQAGPRAAGTLLVGGAKNEGKRHFIIKRANIGGGTGGGGGGSPVPPRFEGGPPPQCLTFFRSNTFDQFHPQVKFPSAPLAKQQRKM